jgi:hypothetical protein
MSERPPTTLRPFSLRHAKSLRDGKLPVPAVSEPLRNRLWSTLRDHNEPVYGLTPLYDVLSAQPSFGAKQISRNKLKLAMAVGDSRHYVIDKITRRHFVQSAEKAGLGRESALAVIDDVLKCGPDAMKATLEALPSAFPAAVAEPISKAFFLRLGELQRSRDIIG